MVDAELGRLFAWLAEAGLDRDTLIVFTSDHGELLGDHYLLGKCAWFDGSAHVPLIVRDPRREGGHTIDAFTESVDIMPTILDWLGSPVPARCDGHSLLPFCAGAAPAIVREAVHWEHDFADLREPAKAEAVGLHQRDCALVVHRERDRKYVHFTALPPLYYDLAQDPGERVDRSRDPVFAGDVADCARKLLSWRMHHEDRALTDVTLRDGYLETGGA
jgi:arylsulfatase A-like enzyme